ncbi:polymeric immunoglobulin receptor precursor [Oryctolagus cuniculus]|uniref:Polymeric immunoglobulin receptor n=1 Tax=Oryctolagus cuniculus TaxID=9986 RepID=PIGR_RABIT|nr:polymeric immunoglobulin receptor precursor [Oryctolagus cuniculus]P01832.1 RecName: Full=Polymeric immunoglobulin receptor; Short=PIgR; Short=Poly-Ig receptor; Contains: RecName: Full=Secretory component; Flags: Precursor [Oryctolagus cuniculus]CAA25118.1 poly-IG receptor [Oryctolagus cuniculus]prf//1003217A Ig A/M transport receptor [Oryctolagus cuniculus]
MALFLLTCLLAVFSAATAQSSLLGPSSIFGPGEVNVLEGDSVSITCYYPTTSVTRHSRKFWCREEESGRCVTLASTGYTSQEYSGRGKLTDFPDKGEFVVTVDQLTQNDSGSYKCGVGVNGRGLDFGVNVLVSQKPEPDDVVYKQYESYTVTITCPFTYATRQLKKSFYKVEDGELVLIIDSSSKEAKDPRYKGRITLQIQSTTAKEFTVTIKHLQLNDAGQYVCQSGSDPTAEEQNVDLRLLTPGLLYGNLGGSVTFECALDSEDANAVASLRQVRGGNVVIDSQGTIDPAFEGRILFTKAENGHFSVVIAGLRKEDTGNYLCGVQSNGQSGDGPTQLRQLFVNEEIDVSRSPPVLKGFPGGSVTIRCPYNPKRSDSHLQLYLWEGSQTRHLLVDSGEGLVQKDYTGRLALFEEPGNGTFSVVLNQLTAEDEGFYWCVSDDDESLTTSVKLQIVDGEPSPTIDKFTAVQGEPVEITCHFPCKYFSSEKYWCKWNDHGCEDLPTKLSSSGDLVKCNNNLVLTLTLDSVSEDDEGWYWCGAKDGHEFEEVAAVRVELTEPAKVAVEPAKVPVDPAKAAPAPAEEKAKARCPVPRRRQWYPLSRKLRTSCPEPRLLAEEVAVQSAEDPASGSRASVDASSASGQSGSAKVLISTLVPLGLVLAAGAMAVAIARARHRRNVDRVSIGSYRTDISMSDLENSREFGAIDNPSACPDARETALGGKDELATATESTVEIEEPKKAKRSSKEEADLAYSAFLLQSNTIAAEHQDGPKEA